MSDALNFLLGFLALVFLAWVLIFGGIGALIARSRRGSATMGFVVGLIPLLGWPLILWLTRESRRPIGLEEFLDREDLGVTDEHDELGGSTRGGTDDGALSAGADYDY